MFTSRPPNTASSYSSSPPHPPKSNINKSLPNSQFDKDSSNFQSHLLTSSLSSYSLHASTNISSLIESNEYLSSTIQLNNSNFISQAAFQSESFSSSTKSTSSIVMNSISSPQSPILNSNFKSTKISKDTLDYSKLSNYSLSNYSLGSSQFTPSPKLSPGNFSSHDSQISSIHSSVTIPSSLGNLHTQYFTGVVNTNKLNSTGGNISTHNISGSTRTIQTAMMVDIPPNQTLYCNNLNDKINKKELVSSLYEFFSPFGNIIYLQMISTQKARGQAFVVFSDISAATNALRTQQGKIFLNKPINIQYSKAKSDVIAKREGTYIPKSKKFTNKDSNNTLLFPTKKGTIGATLLVENIPSSVTKSTLDKLFTQYPGHIDTRLVMGRGIAFIDFTTHITAEVAMDGLQNFKATPSSSFKISLSK